MKCEGCSKTFFDLLKKFHKEEDSFVEYFKSHGVLPRTVKCATCGRACKYKPSAHNFYCSKVSVNSRGRRIKCKFSVSERRGTFLGNAHISLDKLLTFIALFLSKAKSQRDAQVWLDFSSETCVRWAYFCYEVCAFWLGDQCTVGGPGKEIEIDLSQFGQSKHEKGQEVEEKWVFGIYERETKKLLLFSVEKRNAQTLTPIIRRHVLPGTIIYSDDWHAYSEIGDLGYDHETVYRSKDVVNNICFHIDNIEGCWRDVRAWVIRSGNKAHMYSKYLARYLFCRAYPKGERIHHFLMSAGKLYPHPNST